MTDDAAIVLDLWGAPVAPEIPAEPEAEPALALPSEALIEALIEEDASLDLKTNESVDGQLAFIDFDEWWKVEWVGMPEFVQDDQTAWKTVLVHFQCRDDLQDFAQLIGQPLTNETRWVWYPPQQREQLKEKRYVHDA